MDSLGQIGGALLAIAVGVFGSFALFVALDYAVRIFPQSIQEKVRPWLYIAPALAILGFYLFYPILNTFYLSFFGPRGDVYVGLENYASLISDEQMLIAVRNNLLWIVFVTTFAVGLGLLIAVLVDRVAYEPIAKSVIFLPMAISAVGASVIWRFVYEYRPPTVEQIGLLNAGVANLGAAPIPWLIERSVNNFALMAIQVWLITGFAMVILSAALKGVPKDVLEAARVDGANELQIFFRVIIPMISSTIAVVATTVIIAVLKVFDIVFVMTNGRFDTEVIANRMYKEMFQYRNFGRASAIAIILLLAIIPVMVVNIRRFRQQEAIR